MENHIRIDSAMAMLTQATSISHVFDEDAAELGCGPIHYALELDGQLYLVCRDDDAEKMVVVPVEFVQVKIRSSSTMSFWGLIETKARVLPGIVG
jgi:uncharacterized caspase-like protein